MSFRPLFSFLTALVFSQLATGQSGDKLRILTSIPPLYSWAVNVAGDLAVVENLLPADVGPHEFQLRPKDLEKIQRADLVFINGLGLESWLERTLATGPKANRLRVATADGLADTNLIFNLPELKVGNAARPHTHDHGPGANPHLWLDPLLAKHAVTNLVAALARLAPDKAGAFAENGRAYCTRLDRLDAEIRSETAKLLKREVVTFHDAFPYFCRRYGLKLVGVIEEVPGSSPSPRYLAALSQAIRDQGVGVVFAEPQFNPRLALQLTRDLKISLAQLDVLETGSLSATAYEEGMRRNLQALTKALR